MFPGKSSARVTQFAALSAMLLLTACGGDDGERRPPIQADPQPAPAPTPAPTPAPEPPIEVTLDTATTPLVEGTINSQRLWPAGSGTGSPIDGVNCLGNANDHIHALVSLYRDGTRVAMPAEIGLRGCTYEMHTHDWTGTVHIHVQKTFTLGQFFSLWGKDLSRTSVAGIAGPVRYYIVENGNVTPFSGDPKTIQFAPHREILILTGRSPGVVPRYAWPPGF